ncbi:MAG: FAD-dependent monooxygenase [Planctomycetes bacterium]|nr:FAD-dependent monooxygenase [Planctomycetota bacterium]
MPDAAPTDLPESCDVAVVGAGPAGALAALLLARRGVRTLLIDKATFPRAKVCGCCLNEAALTILDDAGLSHIARSAPQLNRLRLHTSGRTAEISLRPGAALSRGTLDLAIATAASNAGATFIQGSSANIGPTEPAGRVIHLGDRKVAARVVLCATGLASNASTDQQPELAAGSRIGLGALLAADASFSPAHTISMACTRNGYVGAVTLETGDIDIAAAIDPEFVRRCGSACAAVCDILDHAGVGVPAALHAARFRGTPPLTRHRRSLESPCLFFIGDAAGYVEPFTGEGISWALASAVCVVPHVLACLESTYESGAFTHNLQRLLAPRHRRCRVVSALLRSPAATLFAASCAAHLPRLAAAISHRFGAPWPSIKQEPHGAVA